MVSGKHIVILQTDFYEYFVIEKILDQIEVIALKDEYESINSFVQTNVVENNKLNFLISIEETKKEYIERINITNLTNINHESFFTCANYK